MKLKLILAVAFLSVLAISSADAQNIRSKARHEHKRITNGVRSGKITRPEAYRLHKEQHGIRREMHRARKNDGHIGPRERNHIRHAQRKHSRHIYKSNHNGRKRG